MWCTKDRHQLVVDEQVEVVFLSSLNAQSDLFTLETASDRDPGPVETDSSRVALVYTSHVANGRMGGGDQLFRMTDAG